MGAWKNILIVALIIALGIFIYLDFSNYYWARNLQVEKDMYKSQVEGKDTRIAQLTAQLQTAQRQAQEATRKYEIAKPYQERVEQSQDITKFYKLLDDYTDYAKPIVLNYIGFSNPSLPKNDYEVWIRGQWVYEWLNKNYAYCGDKGIKVGSSFSEFQFFSPDELLKSSNERCGDCDDYATLFAGMMYASGVPEDKVYVVCGDVEGQGHCWNWIILSGVRYWVDPVCSEPDSFGEFFNFFGLDFGFKEASYPDQMGNVLCLGTYNAKIAMNPQGYEMIT